MSIRKKLKESGKSLKHHCTVENIKDNCATIQSLFTVIALIVGGLWAYTQFTVERKGEPHANIKQEISYVALSDETNLLRVNVEFINTGISKIELKKYEVIIYQILPVPTSVKKDIKYALTNVDRNTDRFSWQVVARRFSNLEETNPNLESGTHTVENGKTKLSLDNPVEVEPGEKENMDFEFVIPSRIKVIRAYSYFRNEKRKRSMGWSVSSYYDFRTSQKENPR